jgi:2-methylisocitrate lyase-like PEP mutase family enzyme
MSPDRPGRVLRRRIAAAEPLLLPGASDALAALVIADLGFEALYVTGAGVTNTMLGMPDMGLLTLSELAGQVQAICEAVQIPVVVDADTGFGGPINVARTVKVLQRAGAAAVQLEDQTFPKRCGHFAGKEVIPPAEMVAKIAAALDTCGGDDLLVVARTDARATSGLAEAIDRAGRYREAGADVIFVEAPESEAELAEVGRAVPGPKLVNMVEGGRTPILPAAELARLGFSVILYANSALRGAVAGMRTVLTELRDEGTTLGAADAMIGWDERQRLVRKPLFDELERRYQVKG